jgi:hypothetical protein
MLFIHPKLLPPEQVADNVEYLAFNQTLPSILNDETQTLLEVKSRYTVYGYRSRRLLESLAYKICYQNLTPPDFVRQYVIYNSVTGVDFK